MLNKLSIQLRLWISTLLLLVFAIPIAGWLLSYSFERSTTASFDARLEAMLNVVVAAVQYNELGAIELSKSLGDQRFEQVYSGWYWQLVRRDRAILVSRSLWDARLNPTQDDKTNNLIVRPGVGPNRQALRVVERDILLPNDNDPLHLMVAGPQQEIDIEVRQFDQLLWTGLSIFSLFLLILMSVQLKWGFGPLTAMQKRLRQLAEGHSARLNTALPSELQHIATTINQILERNDKLLEHSRTTAGNLAHAIKTPLAIMQAQLDNLSAEQQRHFKTELDRIQLAVHHHITRAGAIGQQLTASFARLNECLTPIISAIHQLGEKRGILVETPSLPNITVAVAGTDLQELIGNLLENALKHARTKISLTYVEENSEQLLIIISDDGPGMTDTQLEHALKRGVRFDETLINRSMSGGLGLSIVRDLCDLYHIQFSLEHALPSGLTATLHIPRRAFQGNPNR